MGKKRKKRHGEKKERNDTSQKNEIATTGHGSGVLAADEEGDPTTHTHKRQRLFAVNIETIPPVSPPLLGRLGRRPQTLTTATPIPRLSSSPSPEGPAGSPRSSLRGRRRGLCVPRTRGLAGDHAWWWRRLGSPAPASPHCGGLSAAVPGVRGRRRRRARRAEVLRGEGICEGGRRRGWRPVAAGRRAL